MADITDKALQDTIAELIATKTEEGSVVLRPFAERLMETRLAPIYKKYISVASAGTKAIETTGNDFKELSEAMLKEVREAQDAIIEIIEHTEAFRDLRYQKSYEALKNADNKGAESWGDLFTEIYENDEALNEIFVRLVEEQEGIKITSAKQLQEITGITEVYLELNETKKTEGKKSTKAEARKEAKKQVEECFTLAMEFRYRALLEGILKGGGKYKDLLSMEPSKFYLPEEKKEEIIKKTLLFYYDLFEAPWFRPDLKTIAEEIEAPYAVLIDCVITERIIATDKEEKKVYDKKEDLERTLKKKVGEYIDRQPLAWKKEHLMIPSKGWSQERADLQRIQYIDMYVIWFNTVVWDELKLITNPGESERRIVELHRPIIVKEFKDIYDEAIGFYAPVAN